MDQENCEINSIRGETPPTTGGGPDSSGSETPPSSQDPKLGMIPGT